MKSPEFQHRVSYVYFYYPSFHSSLNVTCSEERRDDDEEAGQFNTLLAGELIQSCSERSMLFGDYIISKWKGVYREDMAKDLS